jgi:CrcB protein
VTGPVDPDAPAGPVRRPSVLVAIAAGGALGTLARYAVARIFVPVPGTWPWSTFVVNVVGSLLLGFAVQLVLDRWPASTHVRPFVAVGCIGAFTTFSTVMVDTDLLVRDGDAALAAGYVVASVVAGLAAVLVGIVFARRLDRRPRTRAC